MSCDQLAPISRREQHEPGVRDPEEQSPPQSLGHPAGQPHLLAEPEERTHREEIPVRLVLQLTTAAQRIPQVQGPGQKGPRVKHQVDLGVPEDAAGVGVERDRPEQHQDESVAQAPEPGRAGTRPRVHAVGGLPRSRNTHIDVRRRTIMRFQTAGSRTSGIRATKCAQRGW